MKNVFKYFIDRPLLVNLMAVAIIIMGLVFSQVLKREGLPKVDMREVVITTIYPGASSEDVELNVTIPLEDEIKGVSGIKEYSSISMENISRISIILDPDAADLEKIKQNIRRAVDNVTDLPDEVKNKPNIFEIKVQNFSVIDIALSSSKLNEKELVKRAKELKKQIQQLSLVSKVNPIGIQDREIHIKVNLEKMNVRSISFNDVVNALKSQNINLAGGNLESYLSEKGIITVSRYEDIHDVENTILRSDFEGNRVLLKDVAKVVDTFEKKNYYIRFNGKSGVGLEIVKKENADILRTIEQIKEHVNKFKKFSAGKNIEFAFLNDLSEDTRTKLSIVGNNAIIGLALILLVLFFFLNFKTAFWTAAGLPVSVFMSIILMHISGITINTISLSGIIIVLGMLVDDAIIIAENTYRHHLKGLSWKDSALNGVYEVSRPVLATVMTTIIAFLPLLFMEGQVGDFIYEIPIVVAFTLFASLFEAFFILPQHLSHTRKKISHKAEFKQTHSKGNKIFTLLDKKYVPFLNYVLKHRYILIGVFIILLILSFWHAKANMKFVMFDEEQARMFWVSGETTRGVSLDKTSDEVKEIEKALKSFPGTIIESFQTMIGLNMYGQSEDANFFTVIVYMTPANTRKESARNVIDILRKKMKKISAIKKYSFQIDSGGPPVGRPVEVEITGNNDQQRIAALKDFKKYLSGINGIFEIDDNYTIGKDELRIRLNYDRIARYGLLSYQVAEVIRTAFSGTVVTYLQTPEERIGYRVILDDQYRKNRETLNKLKIVNTQGKLVPIKNLLFIKEKRSIKRVYHYNGDRTINVSADIDTEKTTPVEVFEKIKKDIEKFHKKYPDMHFKIKGEAEESRKTIMSLIISFAAAVLIIYFMLVLLFNSFSQPFLIILAIPFGLIGVVITFTLHGMNFSMFALLGIIGLAGVVVNDSLVMLSFINDSRKKEPKKDIKEIVINGARTRLRPIILTTLTTAAGLFPTAYGIGGYDFTVSPMVLAISWGLVFATALTLLLIPALYMVDVDIRNLGSRLIAKIRRKSE